MRREKRYDALQLITRLPMERGRIDDDSVTLSYVDLNLTSEIEGPIKPGGTSGSQTEDADDNLVFLFYNLTFPQEPCLAKFSITVDLSKGKGEFAMFIATKMGASME